MTTHRPTYTGHAKPNMTSRRGVNRRTARSTTPLYTGKKVGLSTAYSSYGHTAKNSNTRFVDKNKRQTLGTNGTIAPHTERKTGRRNHCTSAPKPSVSFSNSDGNFLLTRRHFLYGLLGVGAVAAIGGGTTAAIRHFKHDSPDDLSVLEVPASAVTPSDSLTLIEDCNTRMKLVGNFELPYGSLVWANDDKVAACLLPTEDANPLTQAALLSLESGNLSVVLTSAVGLDEGFEIYDIRATSSGLIWVEADILDGIWRVYTANTDPFHTGEPTLIDEGDSAYEMPSLAAVGNRVFWQILPKQNGSQKTEDSVLKSAVAGSPDTEVIYRSHGRMTTPVYASNDSVVITPRTDTTSVHYQLTCLDANSGTVTDTMVLPTLMKPLEAGYGNTGFTFSFDAIYDYGDGISNLGTYTPAALVSDGNYNAAPWFCFGRTPTAPSAWCGPYFMVKSTRAVCGVDMRNNEYFTFDVENGADDYGDYLASTGSHNTVVTFANINHTPLSGRMIKCCRVRVWTPVA